MTRTQTGALKQRALSETATRVLRGIIAEQSAAPDGNVGAGHLVKYAGSSDARLYNALLVLESRWLITWEAHGQRIRPRARAFSLLRTAAYRDRGLI